MGPLTCTDMRHFSCFEPAVIAGVGRLPGDGDDQLLVSRCPPDADGHLPGLAGYGDGTVHTAGRSDGMAGHRHDQVARPQPSGSRWAARIHVADRHAG